MLEAFPSRQEFMTALEELRAAREESNRRFEELRADINQRFAAVGEELRRQGEQLRSHEQRRAVVLPEGEVCPSLVGRYVGGEGEPLPAHRRVETNPSVMEGDVVLLVGV